MKNVVRLISILFFTSIISCSEEDIIEKTLRFDKENFDLCEVTTNNFVYFKINPQTQEGTSFNFTQNDFNIRTVDTFSIALNGTNRLIYRRFNNSIDRNYYCGILPPSDISVQEEFTSSGGNALIESIIIEETIKDINNSISVAERVYQTKITFTDLLLSGPDQQITYEKLELEGTRVQNDTIEK